MTTPTLVRIEDHDGDGRCGHCTREGLRWIAVLSDGQRLGTACANNLLGLRIRTADYQWMAEFTKVAEHTEYGVLHELWQHRHRNQTRETRNSHLHLVGGARAEWQRRGWLA